MRRGIAAFVLLGSMVVSVSGAAMPQKRDIPTIPLPPMSGWPVQWPTLPTLPTAIPTTIPTTIAPPIAVPGGAFTRGADIVFKPRATKAKVVPFALQGTGIVASPDGKSALISGKSTRIVGLDKKVVVLPEAHAYRETFSPSGGRAAVIEEGGSTHGNGVSVFTKDGKVVRRAEKVFADCGATKAKLCVKEIGFPDEDTVTFADDCRIYRLDLKTSSPPQAMGTEDRCGMAYRADSGKLWFQMQPTPGSYSQFKKAWSVDWNGTYKLVIDDTTPGGPWSQLTPSPSGDRVCYLRGDQRLVCLEIATGKADVISSGQAAAPRFDAAGTHATFFDYGEKASFYVDFGARTVRKMVSPHMIERVGIGDRRFLSTSHDAVYAYDLDELWEATVLEVKDLEAGLPTPLGKKLVFSRAVGSAEDFYLAELD